jgi:N-acetyl sugar amidotransferase
MSALYGLPEKVEFCRRCVVSNQRPSSVVELKHRLSDTKPTIRFLDGVCEACRVAEAKDRIDWADRERQLRDLCNRYRKTDGSYDCLVSVSAGKDSFKQAHLLRHKYRMNPITVTWAPQLYTDHGYRNHAKLRDAGFDNYTMYQNRRVHRLLTRVSLETLFHPFSVFIVGQKNYAPKMAALLGVPLIFYGESEGEYGNDAAETEKAERDWHYFTQSDDKVFIGGVSREELAKRYDIKPHDFAQYMPANPDHLKKLGVTVRYMGFYERWDPQSAWYYAQEHGNQECRASRSDGTYSKYNSTDCKIDDLHWWCYHVKFGIGRCTHDAAQEIRGGHISREDGVVRVKKYDGEFCNTYEKDILEYINVPEFPALTKESLFDLSDKFRSPHLWNGRDLRHKVWA